MNKHQARLRRSKKTKEKIKLSNKLRLVVHRSNVQIYSQIIEPSENGDIILVSSSSLDNELKKDLANKNKVEQANLVGKLLGKRAADKGIKELAFDRAGYKFHGRVKALAEGAREAGLEF